jgi:hypothetical protein
MMVRSIDIFRLFSLFFIGNNIAWLRTRLAEPAVIAQSDRGRVVVMNIVY